MAASEYSRPPIPVLEFRDGAGDVIKYGDRWPDGGGPEHSYEVVSHPERFAPLHTVADLLIEHLVAQYHVTVTNSQDPARPAFRLADDSGFDRCVRLIPSDPRAASLTFFLHPFPSVTLQAGLLHWEAFPGCGCDHCDETAESAVDALELLVFAIVDTGFDERLSTDSPPMRTVQIRSADGELDQASRGPESHLTRDESARVRSELEQIGGRRAPWPKRRRL